MLKAIIEYRKKDNKTIAKILTIEKIKVENAFGVKRSY